LPFDDALLAAVRQTSANLAALLGLPGVGILPGGPADLAVPPIEVGLGAGVEVRDHDGDGDRRPEADVGLVVAAENRRAKDFGGPAGGALKPLF